MSKILRWSLKRYRLVEILSVPVAIHIHFFSIYCVFNLSTNSSEACWVAGWVADGMEGGKEGWMDDFICISAHSHSLFGKKMSTYIRNQNFWRMMEQSNFYWHIQLQGSLAQLKEYKRAWTGEGYGIYPKKCYPKIKTVTFTTGI